MAGAIDEHPMRDDPVSAGAVQQVSVGSRKLIAVSDGYFRLPPTFIGTPSHPTAAHDALHAVYGEVRLPVGCFLLPGDKNVLVDTGYGPVEEEALGAMMGGLAARSSG